MLKILLIFTIMVAAHGQELTPTLSQIDQLTNLGLAPLDFSNRARCAANSKHPTQSIFLLLSTIPVAKLSYRLAQMRNTSTSEFTLYGVSKYKETILELSKSIIHKLVNGQLPLLPSDLRRDSKKSLPIPDDYKKITKRCLQTNNCKSLSKFIERVVDISESSNDQKTRKKSWKRIGITKRNFLSSFNFQKKSFQQSCYFVKKFSGIQGHLFSNTRPSAKELHKLLLSNIYRDKFISNCNDLSPTKDLKDSLFQIDLKGINQRIFKKYGHDFWHSFKLYLTWYFYHHSSMTEVAFPFGQAFRSLQMEETIFLMSNGCKSITKPACDLKTLSRNSLRQLARFQKEDRGKLQNFWRFAPNRYTQEMVENARPDINNDILKISEHDLAQDWASNFAKNLTKSKTTQRNKTLKALGLLTIFNQHLTPKAVLSNLENIKDLKRDIYNTNFSQTPKWKTNKIRKEFYYLCTEYTFAHHETLGLFRKKLELIRSSSLLKGTMYQQSQSKHHLEDIYNRYKQMAGAILKECQKLEREDFFQNGNETSNYNLANLYPWYHQMINGKSRPKPAYNRTDAFNGIPLLYTKDKSTICQNSFHCLREYLASIIDLYSAASYTEALSTSNYSLNDGDLFNPYSERSACKVYDPWFKVKNAMVKFLSDITNTTASFFTVAPVYLALQLDEGRVTSFNQLIEEGSIKYTPVNVDKKLEASVLLDFGPLAGVPCTISIGNHGATTPFQYYYLDGIMIKGCKNKEARAIDVYSGENQTPKKPREISGCLGCYFNFREVNKNLLKIPELFLPGVRASTFLAITVINLYKNLNDKVNVPYSWKIDLDELLKTYQHHHMIPQKCYTPLTKGRACY